MRKYYKKTRHKKYNKILRLPKDGLVLLICILIAGAVYLGWNEKGFSVETLASNTQYIGREVRQLIEDTDLFEEIGKYLPPGKSESKVSASLSEIPAYSGSPYVEINSNIPDFDREDLEQEPFEYYSEQDSLGRCGYAEAMIDKSLMPTEERGKIGMIKPVGWHTVKYDCIDGMYLYNRCHLIAYMLTGENANEKNLITGTRYMNVTGMLPFETRVSDYIEKSGDRVLYRVTPIYEGDDLLAGGVQMEAQSVGSPELRFNVYVYNVQPSVHINYANGDSWLE